MNGTHLACLLRRKLEMKWCFLDTAERAEWQEAVQPVITGWIAEMNEKGIDGAGLAAARAEIARQQ